MTIGFLRRYPILVLAAWLCPFTANAGAGWYAGFSVGPASVSYKSDIAGIDNRIDDGANALSVAVGYQPLKYMSMELAYHDYGHYDTLATTHCTPGQVCVGSIEALSSHLTGWSFLFMPQIPVWGGARVFVEGGMLAWTMKGLGFGGTQKDSGADAIYGAGLRYAFPSHIGLKISYERSSLDVDQTSVGAEWRF